LPIDYGVTRYSDTIADLSALEGFVAACCESPDIPVTCTKRETWERGTEPSQTRTLSFDPMIVCRDDFPTDPTPLFTTVMKQLARQADKVRFEFKEPISEFEEPISNPSPSYSQSAIDWATQLSFDNAETVSFTSNLDHDFWMFTSYPPAPPIPRPSLTAFMQPFPKAKRLMLSGRVGGAAGRLLADKLPKQLNSVEIEGMEAAEAVGALQALGSGREVGTVTIGTAPRYRRPMRLGESAIAQLVGAAADLPTIGEFEFNPTFPPGREAEVRETVLGYLSSLLQLRGLRQLQMKRSVHIHDLPASVTVGGVAFTITQWPYRPNFGHTLTAKRET